MEPLNNGHIWTDYFVHYREVVFFQRQNCHTIGWCIGQCPYTEVSFIWSVLYGCVHVQNDVAVKKKGGGKKGPTAQPDRPVDISRLDIRVGVVISAEKVR